MQCGVACLSMICRYFGANVSLDYADRLCRPTKEGVSMLAISQGAKALGLKNGSARVALDSLGKLPLPAVLHWKQNHFVVLYRVSRDLRKFYIADPGKGLYTVGREEMEKCWLTPSDGGEPKGVVMVFEPAEEFEQTRKTAAESSRSIRFLLRYIRDYRRPFAFIFLALLVGCVLQLILPFLTQAIVDRGIHNSDIGIIWLILLGEMMIVIGRTATDFFRRRMLLKISMKVNIALVSDFFIKLLKLPMAFFDTKLIGDIMQRIGDHGRVQSFLTGQVLNVMFTFLSFIVFGVVLFIYNKLIFAVLLLGSLVYGWWITSFLGRRKVLDYEIFEQQAVNQNRTYQFVNYMQEIKLQDCEKRRRDEWEDTQMGLFGIQMKSLRLQQTQEAGSVFINETKNIIITVLAATAVINGSITLGAMLAIQYIVGQLNSPVEQLMSFIYSLQDVKISLERISEIHEGRNEEPETGLCAAFDDGAEMSIKIKDLDFKYDYHAPTKTLDNVSLDIKAKGVTAIVGASGSGKTTLIKLMLGYYPTLAGEIEIAGKPIGAYSLKWWRRQCGVVMQDGVIFSESIERNIATSDGEIDRERLYEAARVACIHDFIMGLPLKYATLIGRDGVGLSQGQRQRILIARAVYRNPSFIFLDEATNSLDAANERAIVENLAEFYRGKTVVVVAHRLSTVSSADCIVVLDKGRVVETGTHRQLTAARGAYYRLVKNQLELGS